MTLLNPSREVQPSSDGAAARPAFEHFRSAQAGTTTFKTRLGTR